MMAEMKVMIDRRRRETVVEVEYLHQEYDVDAESIIFPARERILVVQIGSSFISSLSRPMSDRYNRWAEWEKSGGAVSLHSARVRQGSWRHLRPILTSVWGKPKHFIRERKGKNS